MKFEDGVNCINIYSKAQTLLGRALSNWDDSHIKINIGYFRTIEGLIFYLGSFNDDFRYMPGRLAKHMGSKLDRGIRLPEDVFKRLIRSAMYAKIEKDANLRKLIKESELPFVHYYNYSGNQIFAPKWDWQIQEWENIRAELKKELY